MMTSNNIVRSFNKYINLDEIIINDIPLAATHPNEVVEILKEKKTIEKRNYICLAGINILSLSEKNNELKKSVKNSYFNPIHGKSTEILFKFLGYRNVQTVDGVFLLKELLCSNISHYFYGTTPQNLSKIKSKIDGEYPHASVLGYKSPPFVDIEDIPGNSDLISDIKNIKKTNPDIIWVGMEGIKQAILMYNYCNLVPNSIMIGIGAVFDYFVGNIKLSPEWVKSIGLRWLYRSIQQPKLFLRQANTMPYFFSLIKNELIR